VVYVHLPEITDCRRTVANHQKPVQTH